MKYILITLLLSIFLVSCNNETKSTNMVVPIVEKTNIQEEPTNKDSTGSIKDSTNIVDKEKSTNKESTGSTKSDEHIAEELKKEIQSIKPIKESKEENSDSGSAQELDTEVNDLLNEFINSLDSYE